MLARSVLLAVVLALALSATAPAQGPPASLWASAPAPEAGAAAHDGGRSAVLLGVGLLALAGAGALALLAVRAPATRGVRRPPATRGDDPSPNGSTAERDWHPLPVAGPPPRPAFGPGASSAPPAAPPPPD